MAGSDAVRGIAFDAADVEALRAFADSHGTGLAEVMALTPNGRAAAMAAGIPVRDPRATFDDAQARAVTCAIAADREPLERALADLPPAAREVFRDQADRTAYGVGRMRATLRGVIDWLVPAGPEHAGGASWRPAVNDDDAGDALLARALGARMARWLAESDRFSPPPIPGLYRLLRRVVIALARMRDKGRQRVVTGALKAMGGLREELRRQGCRLIVVEAARGDWRDYVSLVGQLRFLPSRASPLSLRLSARSSADSAAMIATVLAALPEGAMKEGLTRSQSVLRARLDGLQGAAHDCAAVVRALRAHATCSAELSRASDWLVAAAAGEAGLTRWVITRNVHSAATDPISRDAKARYLLARAPAGLVDRLAVWSPVLREAATQYYGRGQAPGLIPFDLAKPTATGTTTQDRTRRILVADTFAIWWMTNWWFMQTSDEFVEGLAMLQSAIEPVENASVTVRLKHKHECTIDDLRALLGTSRRLAIVDRSGGFAEQVLASDIVVAFFSTTILEAIALRRPVLLLGGSDRHEFLPARRTLPKPNDRAAIYAPPTAASGERSARVADVRIMIEAILSAHRCCPLSDAEISPYVWQESAVSPRKLAERVLRTA